MTTSASLLDVKCAVGYSTTARGNNDRGLDYQQINQFNYS